MSVNGVIAVLGTKIEKGDEVEFNGKPVPIEKLFGQTRLVLAYHKPEGEVCTRNDPEGRPTIFDRLPKLSKGRWIAVGVWISIHPGLFFSLLTVSCQIVHAPSSGVDREYMVRVHGNVTAKARAVG